MEMIGGGMLKETFATVACVTLGIKEYMHSQHTPEGLKTTGENSQN
jgi:hypothetical protein